MGGYTAGVITMATTEDIGQIEHRLQQLFDSAAAKSLAVINQEDAEAEMARFLHEVKRHPDQRALVVQLFIESFGDSFYMKREPWEFMQFCMHELRWPELREFIKSKREDDLRARGAGSSTVWNDVLEAFDDHWRGAEFFQEFRKKGKLVEEGSAACSPNAGPPEVGVPE
jgi:hypothetical protein